MKPPHELSAEAAEAIRATDDLLDWMQANRGRPVPCWARLWLGNGRRIAAWLETVEHRLN